MTTSTISHAAPRQLCFNWLETATDPIEKKERVRPSTPNRTAKTDGWAVIERSTSRTTKGTAVTAPKTMDRSSEPQHISGLMVAVLARYGIDAETFLAELS